MSDRQLGENAEARLDSRAMAAWNRAGNMARDVEADVVTRGKFKYVVLRDSHRVVAVYRVRNNGFLRALRRPPKALLADKKEKTQ